MEYTVVDICEAKISLKVHKIKLTERKNKQEFGFHCVYNLKTNCAYSDRIQFYVH